MLDNTIYDYNNSTYFKKYKMGRELKKVALNFKWEIGKLWSGYRTATKKEWKQMLDKDFVCHKEGNMIFI